MNQPPKSPLDRVPTPSVHISSGSSQATPAPLNSLRRPNWRLPEGVAAGTWEYTQAESIAAGYQSFVANTPLVGFDVAQMLRMLPAPQPDRRTRVLDLGCGDGRALRALWESGYEVLGVDLSQPMLRQVTMGDHGEAFRNRLVRANLVQLDGFRDGIADHACCLFSTIGMIRGRRFRRQFLRHVARIVGPDGTLVLHVHNRNSAWRDRPSAMAWLRSARLAIGSRQHELGDRTYSYRGLADMFLHTFSLRELRADLQASGWRGDQIIPLSVTGGEILDRPRWLPGLRAGGFIAVARAF